MPDNHSITYNSKRFQYKTVLHPKTRLRLPSAVLEYIADEHAPLKNRLNAGEKYLLNVAEVTVQGEVLQVKRHGLLDRQQLGSGRRAITYFSAKSRKNMMDTVSRIDWTNQRAQFITLTYHSNMMNARKAKRDLRAFSKRLYRRYGNIPMLWKLEPQKRGAWHFHVLAFNLPYISKGEVLKHWRAVTHEVTITQVDIEPIISAKKARSYICKYMSKQINNCSLVCYVMAKFNVPQWYVLQYALDYLPNLAVFVNPGRFWGIENRNNVNWAVLVVVSIMADNVFYHFKRAARRCWRGINTNRNAGFTLYVNNVERWHEYLFYLLGEV